MALPLHPLGSTGFTVTSLWIGCSVLGSMPDDFTYSVEEEQALSVLRTLFASPINFADTAAAYGDGESERHIGIVLRELGGIPPEFVETGLFSLAISHNRYTLLNQEANAFWDVCARRGVAALNGAPYGLGMLAKGPSAFPRYMYKQAPDPYLHQAFAIETICQRYDIPLAAAALQFSLRDPRISATIVGVSKPERLAETIDLAEQSIPPAFWEEIAL